MPTEAKQRQCWETGNGQTSLHLGPRPGRQQWILPGTLQSRRRAAYPPGSGRGTRTPSLRKQSVAGALRRTRTGASRGHAVHRRRRRGGGPLARVRTDDGGEVGNDSAAASTVAGSADAVGGGGEQGAGATSPHRPRAARGRTAVAERGAGARAEAASGGRTGPDGADAADGNVDGPRASRDGPAAQRPAATLRRDSPRTRAPRAQRRPAEQDGGTQGEAPGRLDAPRRRPGKRLLCPPGDLAGATPQAATAATGAADEGRLHGPAVREQVTAQRAG